MALKFPRMNFVDFLHQDFHVRGEKGRIQNPENQGKIKMDNFRTDEILLL
jgi:hypothetical protein